MYVMMMLRQMLINFPSNEKWFIKFVGENITSYIRYFSIIIPWTHEPYIFKYWTKSGGMCFICVFVHSFHFNFCALFLVSSVHCESKSNMWAMSRLSTYCAFRSKNLSAEYAMKNQQNLTDPFRNLCAHRVDTQYTCLPVQLFVSRYSYKHQSQKVCVCVCGWKTSAWRPTDKIGRKQWLHVV